MTKQLSGEKESLSNNWEQINIQMQGKMNIDPYFIPYSTPKYKAKTLSNTSVKTQEKILATQR